MPTLNEPTDLDALHLRNEFAAMPGLVVSDSQVARLLDVRVPRAHEILDSLEREGLVIKTAGGSYRRAYPMSA